MTTRYSPIHFFNFRDYANGYNRAASNRESMFVFLPSIIFSPCNLYMYFTAL